MADPQPTGILGLPVSVWIALILGVAGIFALTQKPFQDTRPPNVSVPLHHHSLDDGQTIEARLWEDPLSAIAMARAPPASAQSYDACKLGARVQELAAANGKTLVLGAMITGEPYTEDTETRRRTRYAVLAGLYRSRFVPVNSDHIGYLQDVGDCTKKGAAATAQPAAAAAAGPANDAHNVAGFEWFKRDAADTGWSRSTGAAPRDQDLSGSDHVLVLWLDQGAFRDKPLRALAHVMTAVAGAPNSLIELAVLGPADSDGLHAMYEDVLQSLHGEPFQNGDLQRMTLYSSRATASDRSVTGDPGANLARSISDGSGGLIQLLRTVSDDKTVEKAVFDELSRRNIKKPANIALVAERDTLYARDIGGYFGGCRNPPRTDPEPPHTDWGSSPGAVASAGSNDETRVACFSYLRGLDGLVANAPAAASAAASSSTSSTGGSGSSGAAATASDEATGPGQLDYLRRLAGTIAALRRSKPHIKAIGVISSDVYDKLLVLQALHSALPGATFFTFDLDARLTEQKSLRWTRQLIVGSSLGLTLRPELQGDIPPFRDSYQTTTYFATMLALHRFVTSDTANKCRQLRDEHLDLTCPSPAGPASLPVIPDESKQPGLQWTGQPRLFEIGRSQEFDITPNQDKPECHFDSDCPLIAAPRDTWLWSRTGLWWKGPLVGLCVALLGLAGAAVAIGVRGIVGLSRTHRLPRVGAKRWSNEVSSIVLLAAVLGMTALVWPSVVKYVTEDFNSVPTPLFGGANPLISCLVDALAIIAVVLLVVRGQRKLHDNAETVGREFGIARTRRDLIHWHRGQRRGAREQQRRAGQSGAPRPEADPTAHSRPGELPVWLTWLWFPLGPLSPRSGIKLAGGGVSELESIIAQYLHHGTARARAWRVVPVTLATVLLLVIPLEEIPGIAHLGRLPDWVSLGSLIAMQFLIFWTADALLLSRSFILALQRDKPAWPATADLVGLPPKEGALWLDLRLVAARTRGVSGLVWYPSVIIALMAIAAFTIQFREFQFANNPIALAIGTLFVVGAAVALRRAAEALKAQVRARFDDERLRAPDASTGKQLEQLLSRVDGLCEGAFAPYSEQPIVRAVLVPAATYGATVGLQYLHLGS